MIPEDEFLRSARSFLHERLGEVAAQVDPDTELVQSGLLDSLLVLEFFFFLESIGGSVIQPEQASVESLSTLRRAYQLLTP